MTALRAEAIQTSTLSELRDAVADLIRDGMLVDEAVTDVLGRHTPDEDASERLHHIGLVREVHSALGGMFRSADSEPDHPDWSFRSRFMLRRPGGADLRDVLYRVALDTGLERKALADFTKADCARFGDLAASRAEGWQKRNAAMQLASSLLDKSGRERISQLPKADLQRVRAICEEAWQ